MLAVYRKTHVLTVVHHDLANDCLFTVNLGNPQAFTVIFWELGAEHAECPDLHPSRRRS